VWCDGRVSHYRTQWLRRNNWETQSIIKTNQTDVFQKSKCLPQDIHVL
jgi:hypothetical protein